MTYGQVGRKLTKDTNKGIVIYAKNNDHLNYIKQAEIAAQYAKYWLKVPVALICDQAEMDLITPGIFDHIIPTKFQNHNIRFIYNNNERHTVSYYNTNRASIYELSPFDETLMIDSDYIMQNSVLNTVWSTKYDFMINTESSSLMLTEQAVNDLYLSDGGYPVFWATVVYFRKGDFVKEFFETVRRVQNNHEFYFRSYRISNMMYRNDYAFAIAYHLMHDNGTTLPASLPTKQLNIPMLCKINKIISASKVDLEYEDKIISMRHRNLHIMNKFDLEANYDAFMEQI